MQFRTLLISVAAACMASCSSNAVPADADTAEALASVSAGALPAREGGPGSAALPEQGASPDMPCTSVVFDGHTYKAVPVGNRCWFAENLKSSRFSNGDEIPYGRTDEEWLAGAGQPLHCMYNHSEVMAERYGKLYSGHAVEDERGLCPSGWHVATELDWQDLEKAVGADPATVADRGNRDTQALKLGQVVKSRDGWGADAAGTDDFGLALTPAGTRLSDARFMSAGSGSTFWTSTAVPEVEDEPKLFFRGLGNQNPGIFKSTFSKVGGFSVRCVRD